MQPTRPLMHVVGASIHTMLRPVGPTRCSLLRVLQPGMLPEWQNPWTGISKDKIHVLHPVMLALLSTCGSDCLLAAQKPFGKRACAASAAEGFANTQIPAAVSSLWKWRFACQPCPLSGLLTAGKHCMTRFIQVPSVWPRPEGFWLTAPDCMMLNASSAFFILKRVLSSTTAVTELNKDPVGAAQGSSSKGKGFCNRPEWRDSLLLVWASTCTQRLAGGGFAHHAGRPA